MRNYIKQNKISISHKDNPEEYFRQYYLDNKEKSRERDRKRHKNNPHRHRDRYSNNVEYHREYYKNYYSKLPKEELRAIYRKKYERMRANPKSKLNDNIGNSIRIALKGKKAGRHWETLVGYTLNELIGHLEFLFDELMSWQNYGSYWHIDHIKPQSLFTIDEFKQCWALDNLQPLEAIANMRKSNKY